MDMTPLQYIPDVSLFSALMYDGENKNNDFSMFHRQKRLELWDCPNLTNINSFHSIRTLYLFRCPNLQKDLSILKGIYDLTLELCEVQDISSLGDHHRITLSHERAIYKGYDSLLNVTEVYIRNCGGITNFNAFQHAKILYLHDCYYNFPVLDVSPLKNVKKIDIIQGSDGKTFLLSTENLNQTSLLHLEQLGQVPDLSLVFRDEWNEVTDTLLSSLKNKRLRLLSKHWKISSFSAFSAEIQDLTIGLSDVITQHINEGSGISFFHHLQSLAFEDLPSLTSVNMDALAEIPNLKFIHCPQLFSLNGLAKNRSVEVCWCSKLEDVSSLAKVPIVRLISCNKVSNIEALNKVQRLEIANRKFKPFII